MSTTILVNFSITLFVVIIGVSIFLFTRKRQKAAVDAIPLPETVRVGENNSVTLSCYDLKLGYAMLGGLFWLFSLLFITMALGEFNPGWHVPQLLDVLLTGNTVTPVFIAFMVMIFYYTYHRVALQWTINGLKIDEKYANVVRYDIKEGVLFSAVLFLKTNNRLWILIPSTSQDNRKFKDLERLQKERAFNAVQVDQLRKNLVNAGAQDQKQPFFTWPIISGVILFITSAIFIALVLMRH